jgi:glyoxylase-like metal-dependent hydrolase (beta-lactamase superfamily II)
MNRREFLQAAGGLAAVGPSMALGAEKVGSTLSPWQPGFLDIHHINTGRGNSTLALMPDGTSLLIDAGASGTQGPAMNPAQPDGSRRPGQWIARYVERQLGAAPKPGLDYALLTHLHGDHVGDVNEQSPASTHGGYSLTGISDVAEVMRIGTLIDREYPEYGYPAKITDATALNYIAFVKSAARRGTNVERVRVGSASQIRLLHAPMQNAAFVARVIAGNGEVWTGEGESSQPHFPPQAGSAADRLANENSCSIAIQLSYGRFSYFTGGDLNCDTNYRRDPWRDIETPAAKIAGPVSVSTCNHHGYFDACGPEFVRALRPRVWILQSWHASHPAMSVLANLYSPILCPGPRDVFCLGLHPAAALSCARFSDSFKSNQGHILVRVAPGGTEYSVLVLEDGDESDRVRAIFGPYVS